MTLVCSIAHMYPSRWYVLSARTPSSPKSDLRPATAWLLIHSLRVLPKAAALSQSTETVTTEESLLRILCDPSDTQSYKTSFGGSFFMHRFINNDALCTFMTPHKYDHILIYTNPTKYKFKNKPNPITYKDPKFKQLRIYYKCESEYYRRKKTKT